MPVFELQMRRAPVCAIYAAVLIAHDRYASALCGEGETFLDQRRHGCEAHRVGFDLVDRRIADCVGVPNDRATEFGKSSELWQERRKQIEPQQIDGCVGALPPTPFINGRSGSRLDRRFEAKRRNAERRAIVRPQAIQCRFVHTRE